MDKEPCTKRAYNTKEEARAALKEIREKDDGRKKPVRCYQCPDCKKMHLTSLTHAQQMELEMLKLEEKKKEARKAFFNSQEWRITKEAEYWKSKYGWE